MSSSTTEADHVESLTSRLNEQRKSGGAFCDVLLKVCGQALPTHACVLSACSPFFHGLICAGRPQTPHLTPAPQEIELCIPASCTETLLDADVTCSDFGLETMLQLLDYIYTGRIELKVDSVQQLVQLAEILALDGLAALVRDYVNGVDGSNEKKLTAVVESTENKCVGRKPACGPRKRRGRRPATITTQKPKYNTTSKTVRVSKQATIESKMEQKQPETNIREEDIDPPPATLATPRSLRNCKRVRVTTPNDEGESSGDLSSSDPHLTSRSGVGTSRSGKKGSYKCGECKFESSEPPAILEHRLVHGRGKSFVCLSCGFFSGYYTKMLDHLREADHAETKCSLCGVECDDRNTLSEHLRKHENIKPFFCQLCDMRFRIKCHLTRHLARHSADRPFVCDVCGRGFKNKHFMLIHVSNHSAVKMFACSQCDYRTSFKTNLNMHIRIHSEGKLQCPREGCKFQSISKYNLQSHLLTHAKQKPYQCEVCGQKFAQERSRRRHAKIHNPDSMLRCDRCLFATVSRHRLSEHIYKVHENGTPLPSKRRARKPRPGQSRAATARVPLLAPDLPLDEEQLVPPPPTTLPLVTDHFRIPYQDCQTGMGAMESYAPRMTWFP